MARTKEKSTPIDVNDAPEIDDSKINEILAGSDKIDALERDSAKGRSVAFEMLGHADVLSSVLRFFEAGFLVKMKQVKESKSYKDMVGETRTTPNGEVVEMGTWDAFCKVTGNSRTSVDEQLANLNIFGEHALGSMHQMGLGQKDLRKLRKLELTDRDVVIGELEANLDDKDSVVELIEEMASKHVKERDDLAKQLADTEATLEASRRIADEKTTELNRAKEKLDRRDNNPDWVEETNELSIQIAATSGPIGASIKALSEVGASVQMFRTNFSDADDCSIEYLEGVYYELVKQVIEWAAQLQYETDMLFGHVADKPTWLLQAGRFDPKSRLYVEEDSEQSEQTIN